MNKLCIKTKLVLIALLSVVTAFCCVISLAPMTVHAENDNASVYASENVIDLTGAKWQINGAEFDGNPLGYDGRSKKFTLGDADGLVYEYYDAKDNKLDQAPKFVGNYYVKVVAPEGVELTGEYEARRDFEIKKATLVNPSATFTEELDIVRGKVVVNVTPSSSNFYSEAVITGTLESGLEGTYQIRLEFTLTDDNFEFDASKTQNSRYNCEIIDNGAKFVITYNWTVNENVKRSFRNNQNMVILVDENNTLPEGIAESNLKVSMDEFDLDDYADDLKDKYSDKGVRFGAAYSIYFADKENKEIEIANGSKFLITVPVPDKLLDYEKDDIKVMLVKKDGVEYIDVNEFVDESWNNGDSKVTLKSIDFEASDIGTFVIVALKQLPGSVGSWWQIALVATIAIAAVLAIVFFVMKSKNNGPKVKEKTEDNDENKNE